jgi:hypothetical protein
MVVFALTACGGAAKDQPTAEATQPELAPPPPEGAAPGEPSPPSRDPVAAACGDKISADLRRRLEAGVAPDVRVAVWVTYAASADKAKLESLNVDVSGGGTPANGMVTTGQLGELCARADVTRIDQHAEMKLNN